MLKLGKVQSQAQHYDKSGQTYRKFLRKYPKSKFDFLAKFGIGWSFENARKYDEARKWYAQVVAAHNGPTAARAQFQTGECWFAEQKFEKAAAELLKVEIIYDYPQWSARALYEAGRAFEAMKHPAGPTAVRHVREEVRQDRLGPAGRQAAQGTRGRQVEVTAPKESPRVPRVTRIDRPCQETAS